MYYRIDAYWHLDMSVPFSRDGIRCLVPVPKRLTTWLLPFEPFHVTLWLGLCGCLILEFLGLLLTRKMGKEDIVEYSWPASIQFGYISTLKLLVSQGTNYLVKSTSLRVVLFSCYMVDIIITSVYSGGLASILTIPAFSEPADTMEQMVKQNLVWGATSIAWINSVRDTKEGLLPKVVDLFHTFTVDDLRQNSRDGQIGIAVERLQWGHFAIYSYIDQEIVDNMKLMTEDMYYEYVVAFTPRPWALLEKFNNYILMVQSSGISKYWEWMVVAGHLNEKLHRQIDDSAFTSFANQHQHGPVQLGLTNFAGIMVLWLVGIFISALLFLLELFYYKNFTVKGATSCV